MPFFIVYGALYGSSMDSRWHECGHRTAFRTKWMNDVIYEIAQQQPCDSGALGRLRMIPKGWERSSTAAALLDGRQETGVTIMLMDEGLDTGPVIASEKVAIEEEDDALTLRGKLALLGARLVLEELPGFLSGKTVPRPQEEGHATYADPIRKEEAAIDWTRDAMTIFNQVRALSPRPGAHTWLEGKRVKILRARPRQDVAAAPGKVAAAAGDALVVGAGEQALQVYELQPEGRKVMGAGEFMRGYRISEGDLFA